MVRSNVILRRSILRDFLFNRFDLEIRVGCIVQKRTDGEFEDLFGICSGRPQENS
jgi:hypothetical protein